MGDMEMDDQANRERIQKERQRRIQRRKEQQRRRRQSLVILLVGVLVIVAGAYGVSALVGLGGKDRTESSVTADSQENSPVASASDSESQAAADSQPEESVITEKDPQPEPQATVAEATIASVGDIMVHDTQLEFAYDAESDSFDFADSFAMISEYLSKPDFTIANLETTFGGVDTWTEDAVHGYTGYPCFNSPDILATNLLDAGIDFVGTANNHSMDSRAEGIQRTLEVLKGVGIPSTGTFTEVDAPRYTVQNVNGIRIAMMAYTYGANGFVLPEESKGYFNSFDDYDQSKIDQMYKDVEDVSKQEDVDLVVVMLHMGEEYQYEPTEKTQEVVDQLFASGCDIVLGSHPHVLEPFEMRTIDNGDGTTRQGFVIYSLANFISSQYYTNETPVHKDVGVILNLSLKKTGEEKPVITGISLMPTYCQWTTTTIRVIPIENALDSYVNGENTYSLNETAYQKMLASQDFFQHTFWPEGYEYTIEDGYYVVKMEGAGE